jgi:hypothetical protein
VFLIKSQKVKVPALKLPVFSLVMKLISTFACCGSNPEGPHSIPQHNITYNNGGIKKMNYISTPRANSLRELTDNKREECKKSEMKFKELRGCRDPN